MLVKARRWLSRAVNVLLLGMLVIGGVRWVEVWMDLNQPARRTAWKQLQREENASYVVWERVTREGRVVPRFNPHAAMLWLAVGFDPNGNFCAEKGKPPGAFSNAIWRPLGFCKPDSSDSMPFIHVAFHGFSPEAREVARLMIASGADVNGISPDGIVPLRSAVLLRNEEMVKLLLRAGADPLLKPKYSQIGDLSSALETAESLASNPPANRIREMVRFAAEDGLR